MRVDFHYDGVCNTAREFRLELLDRGGGNGRRTRDWFFAHEAREAFAQIRVRATSARGVSSATKGGGDAEVLGMMERWMACQMKSFRV